MELTRGICIFCTNNKIVSPSSAEEITAWLKTFFKKKISSEEFNEIRTSFKLCPVCLQDIVMVAELKENVKNELSSISYKCLLCSSKKHVVDVSSWSNFETLLGNLTSKKMPLRCSCCLHCIKCLDLLQKLQDKLFKKFPYLVIDDSKGKHKHGVETSSSRKRSSSKISSNHMGPKNALKHLVPLKYSKFSVNHIKEDTKMLNQIAFVNLPNLPEEKYDKDPEKIDSKSRPSKDTSARHSYYKIKLKINPKKTKVHSGRISKMKSHDEFMSSEEKKLIVKILKENLNQLQKSFEKGLVNFQTPTKASKKMMPEDLSLSDKTKRKNVTFAKVLNSGDGSSVKHNLNGTPLKSLLKRSISPTGDLQKDSDSSDSEVGRKDSENFLEEIKKHNDDIFDSLKNINGKPSGSKKNRRKSVQIYSSSDSDDDNGQKVDADNIAVKDINKRIITNEDANELDTELDEKDPLADDSQAINNDIDKNNEDIEDSNDQTKERDEENGKIMSRRETESEISDYEQISDITKTSSSTSTEDESVTLEEFKKIRLLQTDGGTVAPNKNVKNVEVEDNDFTRAKKRRQSTIARETDNDNELAMEDSEPEMKKDMVTASRGVDKADMDALIMKYTASAVENSEQNGVADNQIVRAGSPPSDKPENAQTEDAENCVNNVIKETCGKDEDKEGGNKSTCQLN